MAFHPLNPGMRALFRYLYHYHDEYGRWYDIDRELAELECASIEATHPDVGLSCGPTKLYFNANGDPDRGVWAFQFGAYGCTHVIAYGILDDALEDAAETLKKVSPGSFVEPEYPEGVEYDPSGENEEANRAIEEAEADLTYTESGYLASWEWAVVELRSLDKIVPYMMREG